MSVTIVVACDVRGVIGKEGKLPWRVPEDLQAFRQRTLGNTIIMGRKTWDSLPKKPLDGRANVVISRSYSERPKDADVGPFFYGSLKQAIIDLSDCAGRISKYISKEIYIIGGAQIYKQALDDDIVDRIIMTKIKGKYDGDVFFPVLPSDKWIVTSTEYKKEFDTICLVNSTNLKKSGHVRI
jgi:dihydrofolate reductase